MNDVQTAALTITAILLALDVAAVLYIFLSKLAHDRFERTYADTARQLVEDFPRTRDEDILRQFSSRRKRRMLLESYVESRQALRIGSQFDTRMQALLVSTGLRAFFVKRLHSRFRFRRIEAAVYLAHLGDDPSVCEELAQSLQRERHFPVKIYVAHALSELSRENAVMPLAESLIGAPSWYRHKITLFLGAFGHALQAKLPQLIDRKERELRLLVAHLATQCADSTLVDFVRRGINDPDSEIRGAAGKALAELYPKDPACAAMLESDDPVLQSLAIDARAGDLSRKNVEGLVALLRMESVYVRVISVLTAMCGRSRMVRELLMYRFNDPGFEDVRDRIIEVLSNQAEYFIVKLDTLEKDAARAILGAMLDRGLVNTIFGFLARNKRREIENELLALIKERADVHPKVAEAAAEFLQERMLRKIGLVAGQPRVSIPPPKRNAVRRRQLLFQLTALSVLFPAVFCLRYFGELSRMTPMDALKRYVIDGNYYLIYYASAISGIYLIVLFFSAIGALKQYKYARVKKKTFLFRRRMLPGISVIGPAYNEEANIIESVNSLLSLRYPDYEVIIVNDGSGDRTLSVLIEYFKLEKVDWLTKAGLHTRPVRGVYRNPSYPKLTVVDKLNGGKADSLNTGINLSEKEYFCAIDADSLLSEDALLKIAASSLDRDTETVAIGGNIFPVNGCIVNHGALESIRTPTDALANLQFIEYLRAFMAGRIGWAYLNTLLIISGAFGLFRRKRVIECGGYLTHAGRYGLDTVGEDMELVVRLTRHMREKKKRFNISYAHNADCWTEVPEKLRVLLRQRDRWHRGLIEIFSFHRDMVARPRFGRVGMIAMPYFLLFEILGPWVEAHGYLLLILAALLGLLNAHVALWLFIATVMLGVFISISALIIAGHEINYFRLRDTFKLVGYAVVENFGFRQLMSLWRVIGYISCLRGQRGWGKMVRRGFATR